MRLYDPGARGLHLLFRPHTLIIAYFLVSEHGESITTSDKFTIFPLPFPFSLYHEGNSYNQ